MKLYLASVHGPQLVHHLLSCFLGRFRWRTLNVSHDRRLLVHFSASSYGCRFLMWNEASAFISAWFTASHCGSLLVCRLLILNLLTLNLAELSQVLVISLFGFRKSHVVFVKAALI